MATRPGSRPLSSRLTQPATSAPPNTQGRRVPIDITRRIEVPQFDPTRQLSVLGVCELCGLTGHGAEDCAEVAPPLAEGELSRVSMSDLPPSAISPRGDPPASSRRPAGAVSSQSPQKAGQETSRPGPARPGTASRAGQSPREILPGTSPAEPSGPSPKPGVPGAAPGAAPGTAQQPSALPSPRQAAAPEQPSQPQQLGLGQPAEPSRGDRAANETLPGPSREATTEGIQRSAPAQQQPPGHAELTGAGDEARRDRGSAR